MGAGPDSRAWPSRSTLSGWVARCRGRPRASSGLAQPSHPRDRWVVAGVLIALAGGRPRPSGLLGRLAVVWAASVASLMPLDPRWLDQALGIRAGQ